MFDEASGFGKEYSDARFWDKEKKFAKAAGEAVLEPALKLYYSAQDPDTAMWAKTTIYSALGYFISPLDAIPAATPIVGYADDLGVLVAALAMVAAHVKPQHVTRTKETLKSCFG